MKTIETRVKKVIFKVTGIKVNMNKRMVTFFSFQNVDMLKALDKEFGYMINPFEFLDKPKEQFNSYKVSDLVAYFEKHTK